ncbi:PREDICTED: transcription factor 25-like [Branchiostoma belcheri]|uniref:Transcription factor 25-like n=1 Tax=Branchiostoma belcheri TaxID=7741 RepID=A0A6P4ZJ97_BRABE|nr:PREDICTED: transcription factor 25-like [Branchiostoma belcheri]
MSSRALRKLRGEQGLPDIVADLGVDISSEEEDVPQPVPTGRKKKKKPVQNPFDLLVDHDSVEEDVEESQENAEDSHVTESRPPPEGKAGGKKRKKKKKKKGGDKEDKGSQENPEDDIDASIRAVNEMLGELPLQPAASSEHSTLPIGSKSLLSVEHRHLNPENEMKRIFGASTVRGEQRSRTRNKQHKRSWLSQPKATWPPLSKSGISMKLIETKRGCQHFTFEHNRDYQKVQFDFLDAVESLNPNNITAVLHLHPYHVDALTQLSDVCKMSEDLQMASELIERALYSFECSFHTLFNMTLGTCRLDFRRAENRSFYLALFKHLTFIGQRGCYRTALEFCKLLLSLDPDEDPLCVLLMIDFYALQAREYKFLLRMYQEWEIHRNLSQLPNWALSVAMATFQLSREEKAEEEEADDLLQKALIMFPSILFPLLDKCSIHPDKDVENHQFFGPQAQVSQPEALGQLVALFVGRSSPLWKEPEVMQWLERNVKVVLERVDQADPLVEECRKKRQLRYQGTPRNIYRHIIVSEIKDATAALPRDLANAPVLSYDPLPPANAIISYTRPQRRRVVAGTEGEHSTLSLFLRSMMPNYNSQQDQTVRNAAPGQPEEAEGAVGGQDTDLHRGIHALMDAMRDLLTNIQPANVPREDGRDSDGHEWEDEFD